MRRPRHLSYANVMATLALFSTLGGTAYAALVVTGANVKDSTLTGVDVKNYSLQTADLSLRARLALKGPKGAPGTNGTNGINGMNGAKGATGPKGWAGPMGPKGDTGPQGDSAAVVTSYASRNTGILTRYQQNVIQPNPNNLPWYDYNCTSAVSPSNTTPCDADDGNQLTTGVGNLKLEATDKDVLQLINNPTPQSNERISQSGGLVVPWQSHLSAMATVTFLHLGPVGSTLSIHERMQCELRYQSTLAGGASGTLGEPQMVSAFGTREVVSLSLVGSNGSSTGVPAGTYNMWIECSDMDYTQNPSYGWRLLTANLVGQAARVG